MLPNQIKQFLLIRDVRCGQLEVQEFGTDRDGALAAYEAAEAEHRGDENWNIVLVGSDSLETVQKTHASYFGNASRDLREDVARELAGLGGGR